MEGQPTPINPSMDEGQASVELSANRTAMSFERTAMSSDRTLMSAVRTALSLIAFGFTIFQFLHALSEKFLTGQIPAGAPRRFGGAMIGLGLFLLIAALWYNRIEMRALRERRHRLFQLGLIRHEEIHRQSSTVMIAILGLAFGGLALLSVVLRVGVF